MVWDQRVAGSNPATPTTENKGVTRFCGSLFLCYFQRICKHYLYISFPEIISPGSVNKNTPDSPVQVWQPRGDVSMLIVRIDTYFLFYLLLKQNPQVFFFQSLSILKPIFCRCYIFGGWYICTTVFCNFFIFNIFFFFRWRIFANIISYCIF